MACQKKQIRTLSELIERFNCARENFNILSNPDLAKSVLPDEPVFAVASAHSELHGMALLLDELGIIEGVVASTRIKDELLDLMKRTLIALE